MTSKCDGESHYRDRPHREDQMAKTQGWSGRFGRTVGRLNRLDSRVLGSPDDQMQGSARAQTAVRAVGALVVVALLICTATSQPAWTYVVIGLLGFVAASLIRRRERHRSR